MNGEPRSAEGEGRVVRTRHAPTVPCPVHAPALYTLHAAAVSSGHLGRIPPLHGWWLGQVPTCPHEFTLYAPCAPACSPAPTQTCSLRLGVLPLTGLCLRLRLCHAMPCCAVCCACRMTAYMAALHEHCINLLQIGGPKDCSSSIRCVYLLPNGTLVPPNTSSSSGASAVMLSASNALSPGTEAPGSNVANAAAAADYWKAVAGQLKLQQPACLPDPSLVSSLRFRGCAWQRGDKFQAPSRPLEQLSEVCHGDFGACFTRNASLAGDVEAWWTGAAPRRFLEADSSWSAERIQTAAGECGRSWHAPDRRVTDSCATRGVGPAPWNNSVMLNRVIVALVDAFESSACNNTVTFSEAMAVQQIVRDLCVEAGCQPKSSAAAPACSRVSLLLLVALLAVVLATSSLLS